MLIKWQCGDNIFFLLSTTALKKIEGQSLNDFFFFLESDNMQESPDLMSYSRTLFIIYIIISFQRTARSDSWQLLREPEILLKISQKF